MWLPDTPRTTVKGFLHRLITRGAPVRRPLFRLNRPDTEWIEKAIAEDVKRGQLEKGSSDWGFPAFPTKEGKAYKAIKRGRRMVVDYRELNKVTVRKFFLIPNSDYIKSAVAGNTFISVGDLKEGFNQVDNEPESRKKMAVLSAGGCWLPRGLTFGPTNGPEDFQELVFTVFSRRLYKDWYLFVDDLSVATGRKQCHAPGPTGAHDVSCNFREKTVMEKGAMGLGRSAPSDHSPRAHLHKPRPLGKRVGYWVLLLCIPCYVENWLTGCQNLEHYVGAMPNATQQSGYRGAAKAKADKYWRSTYGGADHYSQRNDQNEDEYPALREAPEATPEQIIRHEEMTRVIKRRNDRIQREVENSRPVLVEPAGAPIMFEPSDPLCPDPPWPHYAGPDEDTTVYDAPWAEGDRPVEGKAHMTIYVTGFKRRRRGRGDPVPQGRFAPEVLRCAEGEFEMDDPSAKQSKRGKGKYGVFVSAHHDGHCEFMRE